MDEKIEAVQRIQDYISAHLLEDISFYSVSKASNYSPWYFRKIFIELLNVSPTEYIRKMRLKKAALMLRDENTKIIDCAYLFKFNSVDGFQRAFKNEFGCNPKEFVKKKIPINLFISYGVKYRNSKGVDNVETKNIFLKVVNKPKRKVIIKRGIKADEYWSYSNEVGCDVWGVLTSIKSLDNEPVCLWLSKEYVKPNTSVYVQGAEVELDYNGIIPEGYDVIELPESEYLMFNGEPFKEENFEEAIMNVWDAIKKYDPKVIGYKWSDKNPRIQLEPIGDRGYIELMPIEKI